VIWPVGDFAIDSIGFVYIHSVSSSPLLLFRHKEGTKLANGKENREKLRVSPEDLRVLAPRSSAFFVDLARSCGSGRRPPSATRGSAWKCQLQDLRDLLEE
jgi:hypothetical protein